MKNPPPGFPAVMKINGRLYVRRSELEDYKRALITQDSPPRQRTSRRLPRNPNRRSGEWGSEKRRGPRLISARDPHEIAKASRPGNFDAKLPSPEFQAIHRPRSNQPSAQHRLALRWRAQFRAARSAPRLSRSRATEPIEPAARIDFAAEIYRIELAEARARRCCGRNR